VNLLFPETYLDSGEIKIFFHQIAEVEVREEVGEGKELFDLLKKSRPDLIILDISLPNLKAVVATREIKANYPDTEILITVMDQATGYQAQAVAVGADRILLKQEIAGKLNLALQQIRRGQRYFPKLFAGEKNPPPDRGANYL